MHPKPTVGVATPQSKVGQISALTWALVKRCISHIFACRSRVLISISSIFPACTGSEGTRPEEHTSELQSR